MRIRVGKTRLRLLFGLLLLLLILNLSFLALHLDQVEHLFVGHPGDIVLPTSNMQQQQTKKPPLRGVSISSSPYAYTFVLGAIHEDRPAYKGFLYDVLIAASLLRKYGSTADIWLWVQLSPDSRLQELPEEDIRLLKALNINIKSLPKPKDESFARIVYEKFRPLQMTQYRRVMFLDSDIVPLLNLDYLFHLTDPEYAGERTSPHLFRPNVIMASRGEPCNAGMFILQPEEGAWERVQEAIRTQRESAKDLEFPFFDWYDGWGHNFVEAGDHWDSIEVVSQRWRFHGGHSDQGLLYYYLRYIKQDVTFVIGNRTENWVAGNQSGQAELIERVPNLVHEKSPEPSEPLWSCGVQNETQNIDFAHVCLPIYRDFCHFMGISKPWQLGRISPWGHTGSSGWNAPYRLWWRELTELNGKHKMGLDIEHWDEVHLPAMKKSPLGYIAELKDHAKEVPKTTKLDVERLCVPEKAQVNETLPVAAALAVIQQAGSASRSSEASKYAYAFFIDEIHESHLAYKGSLYSVLVAVSYLKKLGSQADFWVFTKQKHSSKLKGLPEEDQKLLSSLKIQIQRIEPKNDSFYTSAHDRLRVFTMTQYRRVMYLGTETMPLVNLDYWFHLSDPDIAPPILQPNLIMASKLEPCNDALFVVKPEQGVLELLQEISKRKFDNNVGWGHDFAASSDKWESASATGALWNFPGASSTSGLLYYYLKYVKGEDVSIVIGNRIQTVQPGQMNIIPHGVDPHFPIPKVAQYNCGLSKRLPDPKYQHMCLPFYTDVGWFKLHGMKPALPWLVGLKPKPWFGPRDCMKWHAPYRVWFKELSELNDKLNIGLDMEHWDTVHLPQLEGMTKETVDVSNHRHKH
jgi:lipopolysaccharide biosynthesis glycosyltransferase